MIMLAHEVGVWFYPLSTMAIAKKKTPENKKQTAECHPRSQRVKDSQLPKNW